MGDQFAAQDSNRKPKKQPLTGMNFSVQGRMCVFFLTGTLYG